MGFWVGSTCLKLQSLIPKASAILGFHGANLQNSWLCTATSPRPPALPQSMQLKGQRRHGDNKTKLKHKQWFKQAHIQNMKLTLFSKAMATTGQLCQPVGVSRKMKVLRREEDKLENKTKKVTNRSVLNFRNGFY